MKKFLGVLLFLFTAFAYPLSSLEEKQLLKDIAEINATLKTFMEQTDRRYEELRQDMNKRFEQLFTLPVDNYGNIHNPDGECYRFCILG